MKVGVSSQKNLRRKPPVRRTGRKKESSQSFGARIMARWGIPRWKSSENCKKKRAQSTEVSAVKRSSADSHVSRKRREWSNSLAQEGTALSGYTTPFNVASRKPSVSHPSMRTGLLSGDSVRGLGFRVSGLGKAFREPSVYAHWPSVWQQCRWFMALMSIFKDPALT